MVAGEAHEDILREAEESLIADAMRIDESGIRGTRGRN
jgi:hypothetical protein